MDNNEPSTDLLILHSALRDYFTTMQVLIKSFIKSGERMDLHQFRVVSRRIHSIAIILGKLTKNDRYLTFGQWVREIVRPSNKLRDIDEAIAYLEADAITSDAGKDFYKYLYYQRDKQFKKIHKSFNKLVTSDQFYKVGSFFENGKNFQLKSGVRHQIAKGKKKIQKRATLFNDDPSRERIHELRIKVKRYRYLLEPLGKDQKTIKLCKKIQDYIGLIHDREIQLHLLFSWMKRRFYLSGTTMKQMEKDLLKGFSSKQTIENYLAQFEGKIPMEECNAVAQHIVTDRDEIYEEFILFWESDNVRKSALLN
ncbi:MAG: CHAD domain-containing protein [Candidatus Marinimicrobia bacterium]|nr:CHAD domain-containing protein [Candidatus Neomarinimicrobiota bacterium]